MSINENNSGKDTESIKKLTQEFKIDDNDLRSSASKNSVTLQKNLETSAQESEIDNEPEHFELEPKRNPSRLLARKTSETESDKPKKKFKSKSKSKSKSPKKEKDIPKQSTQFARRDQY